MSLTIKQAFEALSDACANGMKNPFFVMRRLKESFADVASKVVDAQGDKVTVTQTLTTGTEIGSVKVNNTTTKLYAPEGGGGNNYSTSETKVGKWIDGSDIYAKTIDMGLSNNATGMSYQATHGIASFSHIVKCEFVAYKTNTSGFMVNCSTANSNLATWSVEVTATQVNVWSNTANPGYQGYCTIYYVK